MIDIFICMESSSYRRYVRSIIEKTLSQCEYPMRITVDTYNVCDLIGNINTSLNKGMYFLEIEQDTKVEKIKLAKLIRDKDRDGVIIFFSKNYKSALAILKCRIEAMDYIVYKENDEFAEEIKKCFMQANSRLNNKNRVFIIEKDNEIISIKYDNIMYFQASMKPHKVELHTKDENIYFYGTLSDIERQLNNEFCRCHKGFIINIKQVKKLDKNKKLVEMNDGITCFVSQKRIGEVSNKILKLNKNHK